MTVNIEALMRNLGKSYKDIYDAGLLPYKTPPSASSGDRELSLDMAKEGVYLSFKRDGRIISGNDVAYSIWKGKKLDIPQ